MILRMRYQKMSKNIVSITALTILLSITTIGCTASDSVTTNSVDMSEEIPLVSFGTIHSEKEIAKLTKLLEEVENLKRFQLECDKSNIAQSCYYYASYYDLIEKNPKKSYMYHKKSFDLGIKQSGYFVGALQINSPKLFTVDRRLSIDESIDYLEQAFEAGSPDATRFLMMIYRDPELDRINFEKAEYYNKIAIKQNVRTSKALLASLYTHHMQDKTKGDKSIELYSEDLMLEKNWESALALMNIYLYPEEFGANLEPNIVKALAYAYVSSNLRDGRYEDNFNSVDTRFVEAMQKELPYETLEQAKALFLELMTKMDSEQVGK